MNVFPAVPLEESAGVRPDFQEPPRPQDTPIAQVPSFSQHQDNWPQLTEEQKEEVMRIHTTLTSQEKPALQVHSFEFEEPRDKADLHDGVFKGPQVGAGISNAMNKEPQAKAGVSIAINKEPQDKAGVSIAISEETQDKAGVSKYAINKETRIESDDRSSVELDEESGEEEWTPQQERRKGRASAIASAKRKYTKRKYTKRKSTKRNSAKPEGSS